MRRLSSFFVLALISSFLLFSCKKEGQSNEKVPIISINPEYANYVSAYTSGLISKKGSVKVVLQSEYKGEIAEDKSIKNGIDLSPDAEGTTFLLDKNTLEFVPKEPLTPGQVYTAHLDLDEFVDNIPSELNDFQFQFQVKRQDYKYVLRGITSKDNGDYNFVGKVFTSDAAEPENLEKLLKARYGAIPKDVQWTHNPQGTEHQFTVEDLEPDVNPTDLRLEFNGKPLSVDRKEVTNFTIPQKDTFAVTSTRTVSYPEQYIEVNFSQPLNDNILSGLVELNTTNNSKEYDFDDNESSNYIKNTVTDGNFLRIYTSRKVGGTYKLDIYPGIESTSEQKITTPYQEELEFINLFPEVKFVGRGNIIPNSDGLFLPFEAIGLKAVRVDITKVFENNVHQFFQINHLDSNQNLHLVGRKVLSKVIALTSDQNFKGNESRVYQLELSKLIEPEPGAIYNVSFSFDSDYAIYPCGENTDQKEFLNPVTAKKDNWDSETDLYYYNDYYYPYDYDWRQRDNPCDPSYYTYERSVSKNILGSNLAMIVKIGNDRKAKITITDILSTDSVGSVEVQAYDLQKQLVGNGNTDGSGFTEFDLQRKPFLMVAEKDGQKAYVRVDDGSSLSLSNFDVEGETQERGIGGFIYGERGVWRPGDSIYLTFVMHDFKNKSIPDQPAVLELKNPRGQLVERIVSKNPVNGFYSFKTASEPDAPTGNWTAKISLGGLDFYKTLKIETIKPNRLKINYDFPSEILTKSSDNSFTINTQWLSGAKTGKLKAEVIGTIFPTTTSFKKLKGYNFTDPSRYTESEEHTLFDGNLSADGTATINANLGNIREPEGIMELGVFTKVFEAGGEFSTKYERKKFSPYNSYVGLKVNYPERDYYHMLETDKTNTVSIAAVDYEGNPLSKKVKVKLYKSGYSWWYNSGRYGEGYYNSSYYKSVIKESDVQVSNGKGTFEFKVPHDEYGGYQIVVTDNESNHRAAQYIWVDWSDWRSRGDLPSEAASLLSFKSDKEKYNVGQSAQITIPSTSKGKALISYENGFGVLRQEWIDTKDKQTQFSFDITEDMSPNIFVSITAIQPHANTENDMPIRMYGVIPIDVENPELKLEPQLATPAEIKPNSSYNITVSEKNNKPMTYTLAVVDEGLLDITNYTTPDIYRHFNKRQSLGVKTWDVYDYVMGAYGGRVESVFSIGGDAALSAANKEKVNRFKPVVTYLGPFTLEGGNKKTHQLNMGNYVGSVKVMLVAGKGGRFGSAEKAVPVRQPLMTLATLPRVLNPGDEIDMPITVFAMKDDIKNVSVSLKSNSMIDVLNGATQNVSFSEKGDKLAHFKIKIPKKIGTTKVVYTAQSGKYTTSDTIHIQVRTPNPPMTKTLDKVVDGNSEWKNTALPFGIAGTNKAQLIISSLPPMNFGKRLNYLIQYPHGCIEQTTSAAFPQLFLGDLMQLPENAEKATEQNVKDALNRLKNFRVPGAGFAYWPGQGTSSVWGTNYALHFMLEAEKKGYSLPVGLKSGVVNYQKKMAKEWNGYYASNNQKKYYNYDDLTQAYRLYTLALAGESDIASMNKLKEKTDLYTAAAWRLAAAYQLAGQSNIATKMVQNLSLEVNVYTVNYNTYGSSMRDQAMILETLGLIKMKEKGFGLLKNIAAKLDNNRWYSTQTTAYALLAISKFSTQNKVGNGLNAQVIVNGKTTDVKLQNSVFSMNIPAEEATSYTINNLSGSILFAQLVQSGISLEENVQPEQKNLALRIDYQDLNGNKIDVSRLPQGKSFKAVVSVRHPGVMDPYRDLALSQMFPSGWEIINTRVNDQVSVHRTDYVEYQDYRDDRVYSYFDLYRNNEKNITILLNATYAGNYYLPAVYCEAMYDNDIYAVIPGKRVSVVSE